MDIDKDNFDQEIQGSNLVLVDFWAEWCQPCRMLTPIINEIETELKDQIKVCKVDIDSNQELALRVNITAIPTMIFFKNGAVIDRISGYVNKNKLMAKIKELNEPK